MRVLFTVAGSMNITVIGYTGKHADPWRKESGQINTHAAVGRTLGRSVSGLVPRSRPFFAVHGLTQRRP